VCIATIMNPIANAHLRSSIKGSEIMLYQSLS